MVFTAYLAKPVGESVPDVERYPGHPGTPRNTFKKYVSFSETLFLKIAGSAAKSLEILRNLKK